MENKIESDQLNYIEPNEFITFLTGEMKTH